MKYTIKDFQKEFPTDDICLDYIFKLKYPKAKQYYKVEGRKCYANPQGKQIHPLKGTIFEKSSTSLYLWFYAIYLMSNAKNGVSAKELERTLGVTYKTAWRMAHNIRTLMAQDGDPLTGTVEVDETFIGGYRKKGYGGKDKTLVVGMVERKGRIKAHKIEARETHLVLNAVRDNVAKGAYLITDDFRVYRKTRAMGYQHAYINHSKEKYVRGHVHTNTIEGFWGNMKRSFSGTYHVVSPKYLQSYVDEFAFRYNYRTSPVFHEMVARISR